MYCSSFRIMTTDSKIQAIPSLEQIVYIHLNSVFVARLDMPDDTKVNLGCWKGQVIEIHCHKRQQQWVPVAIQYHNLTPEYITYLNQYLTYDQLRQLTKAIEAYTSK